MTIYQALKNEGIFVIPNFLTRSEIGQLRIEGQALAEDTPAFARRSLESDNSFLVHVVPGRVKKHDGWRAIKMFTDIASRIQITKIAESYLGPKYGVAVYIYHWTKGKSQSELFPLHYDGLGRSRCLKAYFYLNDCDETNGALRYVPKSHRLVRQYVNELNVSKDSENSLAYMLDVISKSSVKVEDDLKDCHAQLRAAHKFPLKSYDHVIAGKAGTLVLFDTMGVHGGGYLQSGERYIARVHYVDQNFIFWYLPDQLTGWRKQASRVARRAWGM